MKRTLSILWVSAALTVIGTIGFAQAQQKHPKKIGTEVASTKHATVTVSADDKQEVLSSGVVLIHKPAPGSNGAAIHGQLVIAFPSENAFRAASAARTIYDLDEIRFAVNRGSLQRPKLVTESYVQLTDSLVRRQTPLPICGLGVYGRGVSHSNSGDVVIDVQSQWLAPLRGNAFAAGRAKADSCPYFFGCEGGCGLVVVKDDGEIRAYAGDCRRTGSPWFVCYCHATRSLK